MSAVSIALADAWSGQYSSPLMFIQSLLGKLEIEARQNGWAGTALFHADWLDERDPPIAAVQVVPGTGNVTVDQVRELMKANKDKRSRAA